MATKNVVITGTSRGIGFELAHLFAQAGHRVLALSRNAQRVANLHMDNLESRAFDLRDMDTYNALVDEVRTDFGHVDILIHNAGALVNKPLAETTYEEYIKVYDVNVFGPAMLTKALRPLMNEKSHVVAISSMGGIQGSSKFPGLSAYSSSKGAIITLMELLAVEYADGGPRCNSLALGAVQTEMLAEAFPGYEAPVSPQDMAQYIMDFSLNGHKYMNGQFLSVASSNPE